MRRTTLDPNIIYPFMPVEVDKSLSSYVRENGWDKIQAIPVFIIPEKLREDNYEFVLADGNHRRETAIDISQQPPVAIYDSTEKINLERDDIAFFKHHNDPRLYEKLIESFVRRKEIREHFLRNPNAQ